MASALKKLWDQQHFQCVHNPHSCMPCYLEESDANCANKQVSKHSFMCFSCDINQVILDNLDFLKEDFCLKHRVVLIPSSGQVHFS